MNEKVRMRAEVNDSRGFSFVKGLEKGARKHERVERTLDQVQTILRAIKYRGGPWGVSIKPRANKLEVSVNDRHFARNILPRD